MSSYAMPWGNADFSPFDPSYTDREKIDAGHPVPCRLCEAVYRVLTLTMRYCAVCAQGYCQLSHGGWVGRRGACVQCGPHQARTVQQETEEAANATLSPTAAPVEAVMLGFDVFWPRLKQALSEAPGPEPGAHVLMIRKWTQHSGLLPDSFTVVYRGGDTLWCDTASTNAWRPVSMAEVAKVYEVWRDYRAGRIRRGHIVNGLGVQNSTWIIALLKHFESLMV